MKIMAIDPGNVYSAYVLMGEDYKPEEFGKLSNVKVENLITVYKFDVLVVEMVASYGMPVGATVFDTCVEIGRLSMVGDSLNRPTKRIFRTEVKNNLCHTSRAKDSNVIAALIDRFDPGATNHGKGTKDAPGWFHGFKADIWQAYAVGVTYMDMLKMDMLKGGA